MIFEANHKSGYEEAKARIRTRSGDPKSTTEGKIKTNRLHVGHAGRMADWILQCNPKVWDVFRWWDESDEDLNRWSISRHLKEIKPRDRFAFWIGGAEPGVYAMGLISTVPYLDQVSPDYWIEPPLEPSWFVDLTVKKYFFDPPIRKEVLRQDPDFADALVIRMPRTANPIPLTPKQWFALTGHAGAGIRSRPTGTVTRVTARPLGSVVESSTVVPPSVEKIREYREHQLVKRYEKSLKRPLTELTAVLGSGERLVQMPLTQSKAC